MTDETRAELRKGIEEVVIWSQCHGATAVRSYGLHGQRDGERRVIVASVGAHFRHGGQPDVPPPLTTAQQLALSVLIGDESVLPQALADFMIEQGHEYAVECYERGKRDGNPLLAMADGYAEACRELNRQIAGAIAAPQSVAE